MDVRELRVGLDRLSYLRRRLPRPSASGRNVMHVGKRGVCGDLGVNASVYLGLVQPRRGRLVVYVRLPSVSGDALVNERLSRSSRHAAPTTTTTSGRDVVRDAIGAMRLNLRVHLIFGQRHVMRVGVRGVGRQGRQRRRPRYIRR